MFFEDVRPVFNNDNVILWTVVHQAPLSKRTPISNTLALVAQMVKNLPVMWENQVQSLGWEDLLEKGMVSHSSIPAWRILWTEKQIRHSRKEN